MSKTKIKERAHRRAAPRRARHASSLATYIPTTFSRALFSYVLFFTIHIIIIITILSSLVSSSSNRRMNWAAYLKLDGRTSRQLASRLQRVSRQGGGGGREEAEAEEFARDLQDGGQVSESDCLFRIGWPD